MDTELDDTSESFRGLQRGRLKTEPEPDPEPEPEPDPEPEPEPEPDPVGLTRVMKTTGLVGAPGVF